MHRAGVQWALGAPASHQRALQGTSTGEEPTVLQLCYQEASLETKSMMQVDIYMYGTVSP